VKKITKFNDSFFRIKVYTPNFNHEKFEKIFEKKKKKTISGIEFSYYGCSKWNHKIFFSVFKIKI